MNIPLPLPTTAVLLAALQEKWLGADLLGNAQLITRAYYDRLLAISNFGIERRYSLLWHAQVADLLYFAILLDRVTVAEHPDTSVAQVVVDSLANGDNDLATLMAIATECRCQAALDRTTSEERLVQLIGARFDLFVAQVPTAAQYILPLHP